MSTLPSLQGGWLRAVIGDDAPDEPRATCASCVMCADDPLLDESMRFHRDVKCCTYLPQLPNFSIGRLLTDEDAAYDEGRARVRARIAKGRGLTPLGLGPTPAREGHAAVAQSDAGFGREPTLRCPYLSEPEAKDGGGRCTIWAQRNAVCATWFCRTERAIAGQRFWDHTRELLSYIEAQLALWAAAEAGLPPTCLAEFVDGNGKLLRLGHGELRVHIDDEGRLLEADARRLWGRHFDDPEGFFRACAQAVSGRSWESIRAQLGVPLRVLEHRVRSSLSALRSPQLPLVLRRAPTQCDDLGDGSVRLLSWYALRDPMRLSAQKEASLNAFDGRPTAEVLAALRAQDGVTLEAAELRQLVDRGVLLSPDEPDATPLKHEAPVAAPDRLAVFRWFRGAEISGALEVGADGNAAFVIRVGPKEVRLRDPDLHEFGRMLVARHNGFSAHEAATWGPAERPLGWPRAQAVLDALLQQAVLQRIS